MKPEDRQRLIGFWVLRVLSVTCIPFLGMPIIAIPVLQSQYRSLQSAKVQKENNDIEDLLLKDSKSPVLGLQIQAAITLGRLGYIKALPFILKESILKQLTDSDPRVRAKAAIALGHLGDKTTVRFLVKALDDDEPLVRANAAIALGQLGDKTVVPLLRQTLKDTDPFVRANAAIALGQLGDKAVVPLLRQTLKDADLWLRARANAALVLEQTDNKTAVSLFLKDRINNDFLSVSGTEIAVVLVRLGDKTAEPLLLNYLNDGNSWVRADTATALGQLGDKTTSHFLVKALDDYDPLVRANAAISLGHLEDKRAVPRLNELLNDQNSSNRIEAFRALKKLDELGQPTPLSETTASIFFVFESSLFLGVIILGGIGFISFLRMHNPYPLSWSGHLILPEEAIAELIALKRRRQKQKFPQWKLNLELTINVLLLLGAFHIRIRFQNIHLKPGKKRNIK
jgi:HEAT repeat protein